MDDEYQAPAELRLGQNSHTLNRSSLVLAYALVGMAGFALALIDLALMLDSQSPWPDWVLICVQIFASTFVVPGILAATSRPARSERHPRRPRRVLAVNRFLAR